MSSRTRFRPVASPASPSRSSTKRATASGRERGRRRLSLERLEDRELMTASVEEFPIRGVGGAVAGITSGLNTDANLYYTMPGSNSIGVYNPVTAGAVVAQYPIPTVNANAQNLSVGNSGAGDLAAGSDGNGNEYIYFLESAANQLGVFSPALNKVIAEYPILSSDNAGLQAITLGADGNIWFTESLQNKITEFNVSTHQFTDFNVPTSLSNPYGITSDPADNAIWFTEFNSNKIGKLDLLTHVINQYNLGASPLNPGNITYNATNRNVYFVETQTQSIGWLSTQNPGNGAQAVVGLKDNSPLDHLTIDGSGNVWATEYVNSYYSKLNVSTGVLTSYPYYNGFNSGDPEGITLGSDGEIWMADVSGIQPLTTTGTQGTNVSGPFLTPSLPGPVVTDANGNLWFGEGSPFTGDGQIGSFSRTTQLSSAFALPSGSYWKVAGLALDTQNQQIYFTENTSGFNNQPKIGVINPTTGTVTDLTTLAANANAAGITYNPLNGGDLWFTEQGANKIGYLLPGGNPAIINTTPAGDSGPNAIVADTSGNLWVTWYGSNTVDRFIPTGAGRWLTTPIDLGGGSSGGGGGGSGNVPVGITLGPDGNIWVAGTTQVQVIDPNTQAIIKTIAISATGSISPRIDPDGDKSVWVATASSAISIATSNYATTTYPMPTAIPNLEAVVADETDHNVYFTAASPGFFNPDPPFTIGAITLNPASQPKQLAIVTAPPPNVTKGVGFGLVVGVQTSNNALDGFLNTIDDNSGNVYAIGGYVTISLSPNPNNATLGGTLTVPVDNGVAVFSGLTLDQPGSGEVLSITYSGLPSISSSPITVSLAATKLAVVQQPPVTVGAGQAFTATFEAVDSNGNLDSTYNGPIAVTIGANSAGATLGGTTLLGATNGIATFSTLTVGTPGTGYTIQGSDPSGVLNPISSAAFTVTSGPPAMIVTSGGTPQSATVGTVFTTAMQATVKDQYGNPVSGVSVTFTASASAGGAVGKFGSSLTATVTTGADGVARATAFTANTIAGSYTVNASVSGVTANAVFSLTNTPGTPKSIATTAGTPQSATVGTAFATALQAIVKDQYGNPVNGASVTFAAPTTGASGKFGSNLTVIVATGANGVATPQAFTANTIAGSYAVNASVSGVTPNAVFNLTNTPGTAASITTMAGTPQSATVNTAFATALQAIVKDQFGNLVSGVNVTFTAPASGASGKFGSSLTSVVTTDPTGLAKASTFTANTIAGTYAVNASVSGVTTNAVFNLTNTAGAAASIVVSAGTPQSATVNTAFATALQATVKDQFGNPVGGASVTFTAPATGASGKFGSNPSTTATTTAAGLATASTFTANTVAGSYTVNAGVSGVTTNAAFNLTNTAGAAASIATTVGTPQSATVNTAFATALQATVKDQFGNPVGGASVTFTAPASGASGKFGSNLTTTATTTAYGLATATTFTANTVAGSYAVNASVSGVTTNAAFNLTNTAGAAASIATTVGTPQSATVNTAFATALQAIVKDQFGNPVGGMTVTFAAPATGASGKFGSNATTSATTTASGLATASAFTANTVAGSYSVNASVSGVTTNAAFNLTNTAGAAASIILSAGTPQSATVNTAFATALQAVVKDQFGNPVGGASVTFTAPASGSSGKFGSNLTTTATTTAYGLATASAFTANTVAGSYAVNASVSGVTTNAAFSLTNTAGAAASIVVSAGTPQSATVNTAFATALQAIVKDQFGNPVGGMTVTFTAPATGASGKFGSNPSTTATTSASGLATASAFTANTVAGSYTVKGSVSGVTTNAAFSLTNTAGAAASIIVSAGTPQSATVNTAFATALQATVKDQFGNPVGGATVTFAAPTSGASGKFGSNLTTTATTTASGLATASTFTANTVAGSYAVNASVSGVTANAVFSLTNKVDPVNDFLGNGQSVPVIFRRVNAGLLNWFIAGDSTLTGPSGRSFGAGSLDVPLTGDFDGDGKPDLAIFRPSTAQWYVEDSSNGYASTLLTTFGWANHDLPMPGNYYGDGKTVPAVFRPSTGQWFVFGGQGLLPATFPVGSDPVPGDYDHVGKDEAAVYNPTNGQWLAETPGATATHVVATFGGPSDIPVPGAYDALSTGNSSVEPAVWRPSTGQFFIYNTTTHQGRVLSFAPGDIPAPGDYDRVGETEAAVYRPSTGQWLVQGPNDNAPRVFASFGGPTDVPTASPYPYRSLNGGFSAGFRASSLPGSGSGSLDFAVSARTFSGGSLTSNTSKSFAAAAAATATRSPVVVPPLTATRIRPVQDVLNTPSIRGKIGTSW